MDLSAELQACLKEFNADGAIEIRENGGRVAPFAGLSWEVRRPAEKPLLHLWSENHNQRGAFSPSLTILISGSRWPSSDSDGLSTTGSNLFVWNLSALSATYLVKHFAMAFAMSWRNNFPMNLSNP